ncbi:hypothetical protein OUZ56_004552 [Daphnia magna]|uniref:Uncharacterized protein n=1 Tax=Daphnia magna TaxID=35525 RepID=A0ABQ9YQ44_9CRUS|nr:hypothetical protein OUZ56_004552 [Daphnia magna]
MLKVIDFIVKEQYVKPDSLALKTPAARMLQQGSQLSIRSGCPYYTTQQSLLQCREFVMLLCMQLLNKEFGNQFCSRWVVAALRRLFEALCHFLKLNIQKIWYTYVRKLLRSIPGGTIKYDLLKVKNSYDVLGQRKRFSLNTKVLDVMPKIGIQLSEITKFQAETLDGADVRL